MTCIGMANYGNGIVFVGDGASTRDPETGEISHNNIPKHFPLIHLHAMCAFAGLGLFGVYYQSIVTTQGYNDFDDMADNMVHDMQHAERLARRDTPRQIRKMAPEICVIIGGWSKRDERFRVYHMVNYEKERIGLDGERKTLEPYYQRSLDYASWSSTGASDETLESFDLGSKFTPTDDGDPNQWIRYLGRTICANRWDCGAPNDKGNSIGIGGMVHFCALDIQSIQTWIAYRWPEDEPGQPIDASRGERLPDIFKVDYEPPT